jgi:hypothetical protein
MQNSFSATHNKRVPGVVSPMKPGNHIRFFGVKIDDFTLALITPLGAYNRNIGHEYILSYILIGVTEITCGHFHNFSKTSEPTGEIRVQ